MKNATLLSLGAVVVVALGCARAASAGDGNERVVVTVPAGAAPATGWPVVVFSHGFHGCARQSTFLTDALAKAGYIVFAPNHADAACGDRQKWREGPEVGFKDVDNWTDATFADRRDDVRRALDQIEKDPRADKQRIAIVGHSLGGYTALGVAGAWSTWKDARIKAVVALSPYTNPFVTKKTLGGISVPVLYEGGTVDFGVTPFVSRAGGAFNLTTAPKMYVELDGAGHFAWTNLRRTFQPTINETVLAFLDAALNGRALPSCVAPHDAIKDCRR